MRISKKAMNELEEMLRIFDEHAIVCPSGEYNATKKAAIKFHGEWHIFKSNGEAYEGICDMYREELFGF